MFEDTDRQENLSPVQQPSAMFPAGRGSGARVLHKMSDFSNQCLGRGRAFFNPETDYVHVSDSAIGASGSPAACSTPFTRTNADHAISAESLGDIISDLVQKIGQSISASLNLTQQPRQMQSKSNVQHSSECVEASNFKVIVQNYVKPPPFFRGDKSDYFTVHEWEDMMYSYLNSKKYTNDTEASDAILIRLAGKARDVVSVLAQFPRANFYSAP